ncbi:hypothetical protein CXK86_04350 [Paenibacillus sp. BGI2013]|uniref:hypothetical protein n=1 Tax=Paenibacillus TaxID=44249 RepID=UPI00096FB847|nr:MULTISPECIES: hypothetical protein [Paenibacillus]NMI07176.1 hypothetical protein [Paenibacillus sp. SZ31]OMF43861.1 hypothetical protein BK136_14145 [Paenibacillus amylolyticus]PJN63906.1 hypothetical protein PAEAM_09980 [Paenibacillus sp. GM1FR]PKQ91940.1 hypothetical protein CXK86_04350 [Paenibacillus sp. BGI2013]
MYKLNDEKMFYDIADGQAIIINFVTGMYYGASALGSMVLDALMQGKDPKQIVDTIKNNEDCVVDIDQRVERFIAALTEKEIFILDDQPYSQESLGDFVVVHGDYSLELNEFAEVQDLLLADPVHDVEADMGWPKLKEED